MALLLFFLLHAPQVKKCACERLQAKPSIAELYVSEPVAEPTDLTLEWQINR